jgi:hypothetical protein
MANAMIADNSYYITYSAIKKNDDYIGNSWSGALYHNGIPLTNGCTIQAGDVLTLKFKVCDNDSHPVSSSKSVTFMHINPETTQRQEFEISLTQNDGTFSGNTAVWTVIVTVKRFK